MRRDPGDGMRRDSFLRDDIGNPPGVGFAVLGRLEVPVLVAVLLSATACDASPTGPIDATQWPHEPVHTGTDVWPSPDGVMLAERDLDDLEVSGRDGTADREGQLHGQATWERASVVTFADPGRVVGESRMKRSPHSVLVQFRAEEVEPGHAATLWAVVFNNPEACIGECDDPDLFENPAAMADLMFVDGDVANPVGVIRYQGRIEEDAIGASIMPLFGLPAHGVMDTEKAEIHFVVRTHGELLAGLEEAQTTTFNGGCTGFGAEFGTPGPNECVDLYFSSHYAR